MRIAIVNDMVLIVKSLREIVLSVADHEIAWVACNGAEAVEKCAADTPDLVLASLVRLTPPKIQVRPLVASWVNVSYCG